MTPETSITTCKRGNKLRFSSENVNHLGNVLAIITDAWYIDTCIEEVGIRYAAHITQATDYSAFGAPLPGRTWYASKQYRMGFNSEEHENNLYASGMAYDLGARWYDGRLGRMFSVDPLEKKYPWQSSYAYCANNPILIVDEHGAGGTPQGRVKAGDGASQFAKRYHLQGSLLQQLKSLAESNPSVIPGYAQCKTDAERKKCLLDSKSWNLQPDQLLNLPKGTPISKRYNSSGQSADFAGGDQNAPVTYKPEPVKSVAPKAPVEKSVWQTIYSNVLADGALTGHHDPTNEGTGQGFVVQVGGTLAGGGGGFWFGMSKTDGWNAGAYAGGEFNLSKWSAGVSIM